MAVLSITASGRVHSVCGNCGTKNDRELGASAPTCCDNPSRFQKCQIAIWSEGFVFFRSSWVETDVADPSNHWMSASFRYVLDSPISDYRKYTALTNI
jgi:hypothetical protein